MQSTVAQIVIMHLTIMHCSSGLHARMKLCTSTLIELQNRPSCGQKLKSAQCMCTPSLCSIWSASTGRTNPPLCQQCVYPASVTHSPIYPPRLSFSTSSYVQNRTCILHFLQHNPPSTISLCHSYALLWCIHYILAPLHCIMAMHHWLQRRRCCYTAQIGSTISFAYHNIPYQHRYVSVYSQSNMPMFCLKKLISQHWGVQKSPFLEEMTLTQYILRYICF